MAFPRASRVRLVWGLELALGLELYACAVLALHARGLRATPLEASPGLVLPALVIPPVFYVLVGFVSVRPLSLMPVLGAAAAMCGLHGLLVVATGGLFMIPDLLDYTAAVAFALWGSPAVTLLQLTAAPLVFARLRPLLSALRGAPRAAALPQRRTEAPAIAGAPRTFLAPPAEAAPSPVPRAPVAAAPAAPPAQRAPVVTSAAPLRPVPAPAVVREPVAKTLASTPPAVAAAPSKPARAPLEPRAGGLPRPLALDRKEPMIRVPLIRIADQLPVEMFVRGREGLKDTLRPGVSLLVPRNLLLPHLSEGLAPVKWEVVADQFPLDELALTHGDIAKRLPDGSLMLPLDEVIPQIPPALLALSTPPADVYGIEEFPPPFQPHVPPPSATTVAEAEESPLGAAPLEELEPVSASERFEEPAPVVELAPVAELESPVELEPSAEQALSMPEPRMDVLEEHGRAEQARRIATLLAPLLNGLEIGQRAGAGTTLVTVIAPTLSEDSVVRTAVRVVPFLGDARLSEPVTQATLTAADATIVLTPFGTPDAGGALLVTAVASRASLAWLERLSRSAAREARAGTGNGKQSEPDGNPSKETELRAASVPPYAHELAGSLTAFGPVAPTLLRDRAGSLSALLFLPASLEALPLARFARELHGALEDAEIGRVASVILKLGAHRLVLRAVDGVSGNVTMLVGVGRIDRPGLARIELDRAAARLGALVRS